MATANLNAPTKLDLGTGDIDAKAELHTRKESWIGLAKTLFNPDPAGVKAAWQTKLYAALSRG